MSNWKPDNYIGKLIEVLIDDEPPVVVRVIGVYPPRDPSEVEWIMVKELESGEEYEISIKAIFIGSDEVGTQYTQ